MSEPLDKCKADDRDAFVRRYADASKVTPEYLADMGFVAVECDCADESCTGWRMDTDQSVHRQRVVQSFLDAVTAVFAKEESEAAIEGGEPDPQNTVAAFGLEREP